MTRRHAEMVARVVQAVTGLAAEIELVSPRTYGVRVGLNGLRLPPICDSDAAIGFLDGATSPLPESEPVLSLFDHMQNAIPQMLQPGELDPRD